MTNLIQESELYKEKASIFLDKVDIIKILEKYGTVIFTGSFAKNLMMNVDVDILVVRGYPYSQKETIEMFNDIYLSTQKYFRSYYLGGNWDDVKRGDDIPFGNYIGMKTVVDKEKYKIDIWFVDEKEKERLLNQRFNILNKILTLEQKEKILEFKQYKYKNKLDIPSQEIYIAVIDKDIKTIEDFIFYIKDAHN